MNLKDAVLKPCKCGSSVSIWKVEPYPIYDETDIYYLVGCMREKCNNFFNKSNEYGSPKDAEIAWNQRAEESDEEKA